MILRRPLALLATTALLVSAAVATAQPAQASDYCDYEDETPPVVSGYGPSTVTIGLTPPLVKFSVRASDECGIDGWTVNGEQMFAYEKNPSETIYVFSNSEAGKSYADVSVHDPAYNTTTRRFDFRLLRLASWRGSFNAGPEPVRKGARVTVTGTLWRADWELDEYRRYGSGSAKVKVQFKAKGASSYKTIKTVTVGTGAKVSTKVTVKGATAKDGTYRLYYAGNGVTGKAVSPGDFVDVR